MKHITLHACAFCVIGERRHPAQKRCTHAGDHTHGCGHSLEDNYNTWNRVTRLHEMLLCQNRSRTLRLAAM